MPYINCTPFTYSGNKPSLHQHTLKSHASNKCTRNSNTLPLSLDIHFRKLNTICFHIKFKLCDSCCQLHSVPKSKTCEQAANFIRQYLLCEVRKLISRTSRKVNNCNLNEPLWPIDYHSSSISSLLTVL